MKALSFLVPLFLLAVHSSVAFSDAHVVASDQRPHTKPGDTRKTTTGVILTRTTDSELTKLGTDPEKCGEAWTEPKHPDGKAGKTWCDMVRKKDGTINYLNHEDAIKYCESMHAKLPSREDFEQLSVYFGITRGTDGKIHSEEGYEPQILPSLTYTRSEGLVKAGLKKIESYFFWTATYDKKARFSVNTFGAGDGHSGDYVDPKTNIMAFRCIAG